MWRVLKVHRKELGLQNTLINGQCFSWRMLGPDHFQGVFADYLVTLKREPGSEEEVLYKTFPEDEAFLPKFKEYLRLDEVNVQALYAYWAKKDSHFREVSQHIEGVRCLRQDPWECTISFLCSQNNNIKRITSLLETLRT